MIGIGGSTAAEELAKISPWTTGITPIQKEEFAERLKKATALLKQSGAAAMYLHAGTNLYYFTGMHWHPSERMVGALLFSDGQLEYIAPSFEKGTLLDFMVLEGTVHCWEEHESPYQLFIQLLGQHNFVSGTVLLDETTPFFVSNGLQLEGAAYTFKDAKPVTAGCRMYKSDNELAIIQRAMDITLAVQQAAARILRIGISTAEVVAFIDAAHKKYGIPSGSYFCIVLFGKDSSFPHGVKSPKTLEENEVVLIDTGCQLHDYISDITRTYVFGTPNEAQRRIWQIEKQTQQAAFDAAQLGAPCSNIDKAARSVLEAHQLGPEYQLPGLPHRTGHGIGLDIHEWPYIVRNDQTPLAAGMCFSNEPMICVPNEFGIRHEDHIYMTETGPKWFTEPMYSIENPFGILENEKAQ